MASEALHLTSMDDYRYNSPHTSLIQFEAFGELLQFSQDPNSKHLGTTIWDASMVFVKFLEKNCRKGQFHPSKLKGKRVIELGAGCGLAGFGMALLGCNVVATDQIDVLPLLMRNVERNTSRIKQSNMENPNSVSLGCVEVVELDWGNQEQIAALGPPFDFIIGTDIVYVEHLLDPLLKTILSLAGPKTTVLIGYELRSNAVHEKMNELWKENFDVKRIPRSKMDSTYQHSSIELFSMRPKYNKVFFAPPLRSENSLSSHGLEGSSHCRDEALDQLLNNIVLLESCEQQTNSEDIDHGTHLSVADVNNSHDNCFNDNTVDDTGKGICNIPQNVGSPIAEAWKVRRYGSLAARLLQSIQIPE
eukprot:TRINITY_DN2763_c0_g1_i1.p1 TRINITY_DN2763_c0_g1~~TRINITY_DN2763_c0_g1_i1.p1  ORF type:complete len:386 (-),score=70.68 TRINITY_DN2763_c0_g1_i1:210-1292(-)